jgi:hypothetical protein
MNQSWKKHLINKYTLLILIKSNSYNIHNVICCENDWLICKMCVDWRKGIGQEVRIKTSMLHYSLAATYGAFFFDLTGGFSKAYYV